MKYSINVVLERLTITFLLTVLREFTIKVIKFVSKWS